MKGLSSFSRAGTFTLKRHVLTDCSHSTDRKAPKKGHTIKYLVTQHWNKTEQLEKSTIQVCVPKTYLWCLLFPPAAPNDSHWPQRLWSSKPEHKSLVESWLQIRLLFFGCASRPHIYQLDCPRCPTSPTRDIPQAGAWCEWLKESTQPHQKNCCCIAWWRPLFCDGDHSLGEDCQSFWWTLLLTSWLARSCGDWLEEVPAGQHWCSWNPDGCRCTNG